MSKNKVVGVMLVSSWLNHELTVDEIVAYMRDSAKMEEDEFTDEEVRHVSRICFSIYNHLEFGRGGGHFVEYFCNNDLMSGVSRADDVIQRCLKYIIRFMYNGAPKYAYDSIRFNGDAREYVKEYREKEGLN